MAARITLAHEDTVFADRLADALRAKGHEIVRVASQGFLAPPPQASEKLEIAITQVTGRYPGLRIRLTGFPSGKPYAGALDQFLADPVDVGRTMAVLKLFVD